MRGDGGVVQLDGYWLDAEVNVDNLVLLALHHDRPDKRKGVSRSSLTSGGGVLG